MTPAELHTILQPALERGHRARIQTNRRDDRPGLIVRVSNVLGVDAWEGEIRKGPEEDTFVCWCHHISACLLVVMPHHSWRRAADCLRRELHDLLNP